MPSVPNENVTDADVSTATAPGFWLAQDKEDAVPTPADEQDEYTSEWFGNGVSKWLAQTNEVFNGARPILGLAIGDGIARRAAVDIASDDLRVRVFDTDGTTLRGTLTVDATVSPVLAWSGSLSVSDVTVNGGADITGQVDASSVNAATFVHASQYIELDERGSLGAPGAGDGRYWVRDDGEPMFSYASDSVGRSIAFREVAHISGANWYLGTSQLATLTAVSGAGICVDYANGASQRAQARFRLPVNWVMGRGLRITVRLTSTTTPDGNFRLNVRTTASSTATNFGGPNNEATHTPNPTAGNLSTHVQSITAGNLGASTPGADMVLTVERLGADAADTATTVMRVVTASIEML